MRHTSEFSHLIYLDLLFVIWFFRSGSQFFLRGPALTWERIVRIAFLTFTGAACAWVPWQSPVPQSQPDDEFDLRPDLNGGTIRLGRGWVWNGPRILSGPTPALPREMEQFVERLAVIGARDRAHAQGRRGLSLAEVAQAIDHERAQWTKRMESPRVFYRNNATPEYGRVALTVAAGAAIAGALCGLLRRATSQRTFS